MRRATGLILARVLAMLAAPGVRLAAQEATPAAGDLSAYRVATPLFRLVLPPGNDLGVSAGIAQAVADGYTVLIGPLAEGEHLVEATTPGPAGPLTITYRLTVASGAVTPAASPAASTDTFDSRIDVGGGRMLHLHCAGTGSPTIVFDAGGPNDIGASSMVGTPGLATDLAGVTRFCAYDRASQVSSDPAPAGPRTISDSAADLHALLNSPALACPCVLIGESLGGAITLILAATHPEDVAGLVLLDPPPPGFIDRALELAPADSPEADLANGVPNPENPDFIASLRQVETPVLPASVPVVLLTHGVGYPPLCPCSPGYPADELEAWWQEAQAALADALDGKLVVAEGSSHFISTDRPDLIVAATRSVVNAVRDPSTWATPVASSTGLGQPRLLQASLGRQWRDQPIALGDSEVSVALTMAQQPMVNRQRLLKATDAVVVGVIERLVLDHLASADQTPTGQHHTAAAAGLSEHAPPTGSRYPAATRVAVPAAYGAGDAPAARC